MLMSLSDSWWRHQMETFPALLAVCAGNSPVTGEFPTQRPETGSFHVFFDLRLDKRLSKQWWGWSFETPSCPLWRHCNVLCAIRTIWEDYILRAYSVHWYKKRAHYQFLAETGQLSILRITPFAWTERRWLQANCSMTCNGPSLQPEAEKGRSDHKACCQLDSA